MHILNKFFDRVVCISLVESEQRYNHIKTQVDSMGIDVYFHRVVIHPFCEQIIQGLNRSGVAQMPYAGCINEFSRAREHYAVIKRAKLQGCQRLLILEDDVVIPSEMVIEEYLNSLGGDWDLILFGASSAAYALSAKAMEFYLTCQDTKYGTAHAPLIAMQDNTSIRCFSPSKLLMTRQNILESSIGKMPHKVDCGDFFSHWKLPVRRKWWKKLLGIKSE